MIAGATAVKNDLFDALGQGGLGGEGSPMTLALATLAASFSRSGSALLVVDAAASVTPATSSMNCT